MAPTASRPRVLIVGGGAGGTLAAVHLTRTAARRATDLDLVVIDPLDRLGTGAGFGTTDARHLLNVPASGMTALPEDPGHFVDWRRRTGRGVGDPYEFAPRRDFAHYLDDTLRQALADAAGTVQLSHVRAQAVRTTADPRGVAVDLDDGRRLDGAAIVIAPGLPAPAATWAPTALADSPFFVDDVWAPGALAPVARDRALPPDVLVVGTGLTMVDVAMTLEGSRPGRTLRALSRGGDLPEEHAPTMLLPVIPEVSDWGIDLPSIADEAARYVRTVESSTGNWRPAIDGLRFQVATLWGRLSEDDRLAFLSTYSGAWNRRRHRIPPASAERIARMQDAGSLSIGRGEIESAAPLPGGGLSVRLADGSSYDVGWVVNCTGPGLDVTASGDPLLADLLRDRAGVALATLATAGMGFRTDNGRLLDSSGAARNPIWVLGALRRGELWESTAVPEIRTQAQDAATAVLDEIAPLPRRLADGRLVPGSHPIARPRDPLGLPISTTADAAVAFNAGLERVMRLQNGAEELIGQAVAIDPGFALGHAALAMLGHEAGAGTDVPTSLRLAQEAVSVRGDDRERGLVEVVTQRVADVRGTGAMALFKHLSAYPRDVLAVSAAVPTIAFSGVTDVQREVWDIVEGLGPAYGDHWWYISLLAYTRQDQSRFDEAGLLAESALACEPSSGHAVHALAHVLYETGQHETGRTWLDHWVSESGRSASHLAHFAWHAALHELALGDTEAVRRRYYSQLAPPTVTGVRSLIDSASLLWRWQVAASLPDFGGGPVPPVEPILGALDPALVRSPQTPFVALHAGFALATAGDAGALGDLATYLRASTNPVMSGVVAGVVDGLEAMVGSDFALAAQLFTDASPRLAEVGGSAAQREIIEESLLSALAQSSQAVRSSAAT